MSAPRFKTVQFADDALARNFRSVQEVTDYLLDDPEAAGVLLVNQELSAGVDNLLPHGLKRLPVGWVLHGQSTPAIVWEDKTQRDSEYVVLRSTINTVVGVKVY